MMHNPLLLLPLLPLLLILSLPDTLTASYFGLDGAENVVLNATEGKRVIVNGVDVEGLVAKIASLEAAQASLAESTAAWSPLEKIFVVGGSSKLGYMDTVERYDTAANQWRAMPRMNRVRFGVPLVFYNNGLLAIGGWTGPATNILHTSCERFDGFVWQLLDANMTQSRAGHGAAVYNRHVYAVGGWAGGNTWVASVERFDGSVWSGAPSIPAPRGEVAVITYKAHMYCIGGHEGATGYASVFRFDGVAWTTWTSMQTTRRSAALAIFNNLLYVIGGQISQGPNVYTQTIEFTDGTQAWNYTQSVPSLRSGSRAAVVDGELYLAGGFDGEGTEMLVFNGTTWRTAPALFTHRAFFGMAVWGQ